MLHLEARLVGKVYRSGARREVCAVDAISLAIAPGSFVLLTGASGSGKTTLLSMLGGLERPTSGSVFFAGRDLNDCAGAELARIRRKIGFVFQDHALIPGLAVWENITYGLIPRGVGRAERSRIANALLDKVGLKECFSARPRELSGGEQQRISLARALAGNPEIVLADEPTSNLDDVSARAVMELLRQVHSEGTTVVAASHDPRLNSLATQIHVLEAGRIITAGRTPGL